MAPFLAQEWLDLQREAAAEVPPAPGAAATIEHLVTGAPDGNVVYTTRLEEGRIVEAVIGKATGDPDLTFTLSYEGAQRIARGELETGAAFMQGALKVDGDMAKLIVLLELMHHPEYRAIVSRLADRTQF